jgi:ubiquinone/menaquinone biosynthesis C-methylase UbiE
MKVRDSGMPEEIQWNDFFHTGKLLKALNIDSQITDLVEVGCGYGTFTIPASKLIRGKLYAFDIEQEMIDNIDQKTHSLKINNVISEQRDILVNTTGLPDNSIDYVMLFNILHHDSPLDFLNEAYRILKPEGKIGIVHWRSDIITPRGPDISIRPRPEQIVEWVDFRKFRIVKPPFVIEPYHFGLVISKV